MQRGLSRVQAFSFKQDNEFYKKTVEEVVVFSVLCWRKK